ncbi:unnamed protein product [Urochloa humidicola]
MANFPVDPRPFMPPGFTLVPRVIAREPTRLRCFLSPTLVKENEDLAIAITVPLPPPSPPPPAPSTRRTSGPLHGSCSGS